MNAWSECFRSVGDVWFVWLACVAVLAWSVRRSVGRLNLRRLQVALADERGATYVLPYMLTFPIYLLVMCLMIQSTMILMVKMVSMQAAQATARSAVVWRSAHPFDDKGGGNLAVERGHYAAAIAMTPVASSQDTHMENPLLESDIFHKATDLDWAHLRQSIYRNSLQAYQDAYRDIASDNVERDEVRTNPVVRLPDEIAPDKYLDKKLRYAAWATRVEIDSDPKYNQWNEPFTIELVYLMPMNIPGAGRILGQFHGRGEFHSRLIVTKATMTMESPKTENRRLGIGYAPSLVR
ncbi:hypothetical protein OAS39_10245 [Pirellulales bacterium]|nr:hypothetical protein [Pirellulales bacterium]